MFLKAGQLSRALFQVHNKGKHFHDQSIKFSYQQRYKMSKSQVGNVRAAIETLSTKSEQQSNNILHGQISHPQLKVLKSAKFNQLIRQFIGVEFEINIYLALRRHLSSLECNQKSEEAVKEGKHKNFKLKRLFMKLAQFMSKQIKEKVTKCKNEIFYGSGGQLEEWIIQDEKKKFQTKKLLQSRQTIILRSKYYGFRPQFQEKVENSFLQQNAWILEDFLETRKSQENIGNCRFILEVQNQSISQKEQKSQIKPKQSKEDVVKKIQALIDEGGMEISQNFLAHIANTMTIDNLSQMIKLALVAHFLNFRSDVECFAVEYNNFQSQQNHSIYNSSQKRKIPPILLYYVVDTSIMTEKQFKQIYSFAKSMLKPIFNAVNAVLNIIGINLQKSIMERRADRHQRFEKEMDQSFDRIENTMDDISKIFQVWHAKTGIFSKSPFYQNFLKLDEKRKKSRQNDLTL